VVPCTAHCARVVHNPLCAIVHSPLCTVVHSPLCTSLLKLNFPMGSLRMVSIRIPASLRWKRPTRSLATAFWGFAPDRQENCKPGRAYRRRLA
jgi:hypothetical protein